MTEYALVNPADEVVRFSTRVSRDVSTKKDWRWLEVEVTRPSYDPATEVLEGPDITVLSDRVTRVWTVRDKTTNELEADKEARLDAFDLLTLRCVFNHENRIRALEGKAAVTALQFRTALKGML